MAALVQQVLQPKAKRKLLALDGGGIRGIATIEILAALERHVRVRSGNAHPVLADFFDYVGGTSTGAIIATCIALGMSVDEVRGFYVESGALIFDRARLIDRYFRFRYAADALSDKLREVIGAGATLGSDRLRTLLLLVMRNATTDSPWPSRIIRGRPSTWANARI
jgi:predicted acylesterase/phospholipase RssA